MAFLRKNEELPRLTCHSLLLVRQFLRTLFSTLRIETGVSATLMQDSLFIVVLRLSLGCSRSSSLKLKEVKQEKKHFVSVYFQMKGNHTQASSGAFPSWSVRTKTKKASVSSARSVFKEIQWLFVERTKES